jgi:hypothetical protein
MPEESMNRTLLLALMIAGSALSAAHAQMSPAPKLSSPSFPLDSAAPGDSGGSTVVMPPSLPSPSAPGLATPNSPSSSQSSYSSGSAGIPGGGAATPPPATATPPGIMYQRPDIQSQPPGAGLNSGAGYDIRR